MSKKNLESKKPERWIKCQGCPCFNSGYDYPVCNLDYDTDLYWFDKNGNRVENTEGRNHLNKDINLIYASTNCELVEVVTRFSVFKPVRVVAK